MKFKNYYKDPSSKIIIGVVLWYVLFHFFLTHFCRDDLFYKSLLPSFNCIGDFYDFFVNRYFTWSSRTLADILSVFLTYSPIWIWQIINICVYTLIIITTAKILTQLYKNKEDYSNNLLLTALFFIVLFPIFDMKTAGWVTTSINYLWTMLAFISICLYLIKSFYSGENSKISTVLFWMATVYACTFELLAVMTVLFLSFVVFIKVKERLSCKLEFIAFFISVVFLFYHLLCPGNFARSIASIDLFSSWNSMNTVEHINIALCSTYARLTSFRESTGVQVYLLYFIFNLLILINIHKKYKDIILDLMFFFPLCFSYLFNQTDFQFESIYDFSESVSSFCVGQFRYTYQSILSALLIGLNLVGLLILFINSSFYGINCGLLVSFLYIVALGTRLALGLSPSVYASNYRTFIVFVFYLIFICLILLKNLEIFKWLKKEYSCKS